MKYEIKYVRQGEEKELLTQGWEPFGVSPHNTSYRFLDTTSGKQETHYQTTDYIYLRKLEV